MIIKPKAMDLLVVSPIETCLIWVEYRTRINLHRPTQQHHDHAHHAHHPAGPHSSTFRLNVSTFQGIYSWSFE